MAKTGNFITIKNRTIFIKNDKEGNPLTEAGTIKYRIVSEGYDPRIVHEASAKINNQIVEVFTPQGNRDFYFPAAWLDTNIGKIKELQEEGILQTQ